MYIVRRLSSSAPPLKYFVTTPIFYPNAAPHLGHLYSSLLCDTRHRWEKLMGRESRFTTGTDEHGLKIQGAAEKRGVPPQQFVDELAVVFKGLCSKAGIDYDRFIRTTDPDHIATVTKFWEDVCDKGYIYENTHSGWYSVSDETFYPESKIKKENDKYYSIETGTEVVYQSEKNYFFKLSQFRDDLIKMMEANGEFIIPRSRQVALMKELTSGPLEDLSVSRPSSRLKWGIQVPGDDSQKMYVWFDALINYLTACSKGDVRSVWEHTNTTHLIGKDIVRFHTIYWPAFLMAVGLKLPHQVVVHGHWLSNGVKMSKSIGNVVDPIAMIDKYGQDAVRWFLLENSVLDSDGDFNEARLANCRELLVSKYANLISRCCGAKFNIQRVVSESHDITVFADDPNYPAIKACYDQLAAKLNSLTQDLDNKVKVFDFSHAVQELWLCINEANTFVTLTEPWARKGAQQDLAIFTAIDTARVVSILAQPFIPELSAKFLDRMHVENRTVEFAALGSDRSYGQGANKKGHPAPIERLK